MSEQKEQERPPISKEEMEKRKKEITQFHKEQIEFLTTQSTYEELLTKIEELRLRRMVAMMRQGEMMAPPEEEKKENIVNSSEKKEVVDMVQPEEGAPKEPVFRTLKKD